jgi:hypothetical protein
MPRNFRTQDKTYLLNLNDLAFCLSILFNPSSAKHWISVHFFVRLITLVLNPGFSRNASSPRAYG